MKRDYLEKLELKFFNENYYPYCSYFIIEIITNKFLLFNDND
jgi:hypothetical protein